MACFLEFALGEQRIELLRRLVEQQFFHALKIDGVDAA
jgi:hypothetical protein